MISTKAGSRNITYLLLHGTTAVFTLSFAWLIFNSNFVTTGLQFVAPLLIVLMVHIVWMALCRELNTGFSEVVLARTAQTALLTMATIVIVAILAPMPARGSADDIVGQLLGVTFCLAIIAGIIVIVAFILRLLYKTLRALNRAFTGKNSDKHDTRLFDFGSLGVAIFLLSAASMEGVPKAYSFATSNQSTATALTTASPEDVWESMGKATSSKFPLPNILRVIPQPTAVLIDEGVNLGSMRVVKFTGREGEGLLTLKVVMRTDEKVIFRVLADTTPISQWIKHKTLTYIVEQTDTGTRLSARLDYERLLSPSWFFTPMTRIGTYFAMDVLVRDTAERAEILCKT